MTTNTVIASVELKPTRTKSNVFNDVNFFSIFAADVIMVASTILWVCMCVCIYVSGITQFRFLLYRRPGYFTAIFL